MDIRDVNKLAQNVATAVYASLSKNRAKQNKEDTKTFDENDKKKIERNTTEVNKAMNNLKVSTKPQEAPLLSDPEEDAARKFLIFNGR